MTSFYSNLNIPNNVLFIKSHVQIFICLYGLTRASLVAQMATTVPAVRESHVCPLRWEDTLEKGMAIHSSILAWRIPWTDSPSVCKGSDTSITEMKTEINKGNLIKPKSFCTAKETKQGEKTTFRMGENNSK